MSGLYPDNAPNVLDWQSAGKVGTGFSMTNLTGAENLVTRLSEESCPLFGEAHL